MTTTCQHGTWTPKLADCQTPQFNPMQPNANIVPFVFPMPTSTARLTSTPATSNKHDDSDSTSDRSRTSNLEEKRCPQPKAKLPYGEVCMTQKDRLRLNQSRFD